MAVRGPRYPREEFARRGRGIYENAIRPVLQPSDNGKFVAIDIESATYEIDANDHAATSRLIERLPDVQIWLVRVGQPTVSRIGKHRPGCAMIGLILSWFSTLGA